MNNEFGNMRMFIVGTTSLDMKCRIHIGSRQLFDITVCTKPSSFLQETKSESHFFNYIP